MHTRADLNLFRCRRSLSRPQARPLRLKDFSTVYRQVFPPDGTASSPNRPWVHIRCPCNALVFCRPTSHYISRRRLGVCARCALCAVRCARRLARHPRPLVGDLRVSRPCPARVPASARAFRGAPRRPTAAHSSPQQPTAAPQQPTAAHSGPQRGSRRRPPDFGESRVPFFFWRASLLLAHSGEGRGLYALDLRRGIAAGAEHAGQVGGGLLPNRGWKVHDQDRLSQGVQGVRS